MQLLRNPTAVVIVGILIAGVAIIVWRAAAPTSDGASVNVTVPTLSVMAASGKTAFDANCVQCHGENAAGTDKGPPLIHDIYNPGHHGDGAFALAARQGVRQHHWRFGNMPARPGIGDAEMAAIIRYVRELQVANGVTYRAHNM